MTVTGDPLDLTLANPAQAVQARQRALRRSEAFGRKLLREQAPTSPDAFNIGLLVPTSGVLGIVGPAAYACARLACESWNAEGGVDGREVKLTVLDSGAPAARMEAELGGLLDDHALDAVVNASNTASCQLISRIVAARVPLIYTPHYEGTGLPPWVHAIGETPHRQLLPAIDWVAHRHRVRRWFLLGQDYCWPRETHRAAVAHIRARGDEVVGESYVPLGARDFGRVIDRMAASNADGVLISLIGADAVHMCRAFGAAGLSRRMVRLSVAIEENALLGMGWENTEGMYIAHGYFGNMDSDANGSFRERYHQRFGDRAPTLSGPAQSVYEGFVHLHRQAAQASGRVTRTRLHSLRIGHAGAGRSPAGAGGSSSPRDTIFLARAEGLGVKVIDAFAGPAG